MQQGQVFELKNGDVFVVGTGQADLVIGPFPRVLHRAVLSRCQELVPVLGGGGCASEVRFDRLHEPRLVRGEAVPVEEQLEVGE